MSNFKSYKSFLIDIGTPISAVKDEIKGHITAAGWTLLNDTGTYFDVVPSIGGVGNALGSDVLRMEFSSTAITCRTAMRYTSNFAGTQRVYIQASSQLSGYARKLTISIGGVQEQTIDMTAHTALPAADFANHIVNQLNTSTNANIRKFIWKTDPLDINYILAQGVELSTGVITANTGTVTVRAPDYTANTVVVTDFYALGAPSWNTQKVSVDYGSGFIYFISIHDRAISIATKTTSAISPIVVSAFLDNTTARSNCPTGCVPIELYVFTHRLATFTSYSPGENVTKTYAVSHGYGFIPLLNTTSEQHLSKNPVTRDIAYPSQKYQDTIQASNTASTSSLPNIRRAGHNWTTGNVTNMANMTIANIYPLAVPVSEEGYMSPALSGDEKGGSIYIPPARLDDIYIFFGTATDESLHLIQDYDVVTTVGVELSSSGTEVTVLSTEGFPSVGTITIDSEIVEYTGKTATSFTGLTRGRYGTTAASHIVTANVYNITWFTKLGQGLMVAGYTRPTG